MSGLRVDVSGLLKSTGGVETLVVTEPLPPVEKGHDRIDVVGPVRSEVVLREAGGTVLAEGTLLTDVVLTCGRCLNKYTQHVKQKFREVYRPHRDFNRGDPEEREEEQAFAIEESKIDLTPLLTQTLVLAVPFKPLCREDCPGLCPVCGEALDKGKHNHGETEEEETGYKAALKRYLEEHPELDK
ncbi:MAG: DUF177 domain-containing protein [Actinomycetota bacterium]